MWDATGESAHFKLAKLFVVTKYGIVPLLTVREQKKDVRDFSHTSLFLPQFCWFYIVSPFVWFFPCFMVNIWVLVAWYLLQIGIDVPCNVGITIFLATHDWLWFIPTYTNCLWWWLSDGLWHCYTMLYPYYHPQSMDIYNKSISILYTYITYIINITHMTWLQIQIAPGPQEAHLRMAGSGILRCHHKDLRQRPGHPLSQLVGPLMFRCSPCNCMGKLVNHCYQSYLISVSLHLLIILIISNSSITCKWRHSSWKRIIYVINGSCSTGPVWLTTMSYSDVCSAVVLINLETFVFCFISPPGSQTWHWKIAILWMMFPSKPALGELPVPSLISGEYINDA